MKEEVLNLIVLFYILFSFLDICSISFVDFAFDFDALSLLMMSLSSYFYWSEVMS